jgi:hypothetical protein
MGQRVIILGTYWGTLEKTCWELHFELEEYVEKVMLGTHWACGWNNIIPKRKEFILFV